MSKKLTWLDKFAEEQATKMQKTAALNKQAEQIIVDSDEVPGAVNGSEVSYKNSKYKVIDASYEDEIGTGIVLEKCGDENQETTVEAALEDDKLVEEDPFVETPETPESAPIDTVPVVETTAPATPVPASAPVGEKKLTDEPERARTNPGDVYSIGDVRDQVEPAKFNAEANETAQQIAQENSVDRTTPAGKYSTNPILNNIVNGPTDVSPVETPVEEPTAEPVVEEPVVEEPVVEEPVVEEPVVEEPVVEEPAVEEPDKTLVGSKIAASKNRIINRIISGK